MIKNFLPLYHRVKNLLFHNEHFNERFWEMEIAYQKASKIITSCSSLEHMKMVGRCLKNFKECYGKEFILEYTQLIDEYYKKLDELSYDLRIDDSDYIYNVNKS